MCLIVTYDLIHVLCEIWNLSDLEFDLSRSLKVKSDGAVELPAYDFLLVFCSNINN